MSWGVLRHGLRLIRKNLLLGVIGGTSGCWFTYLLLQLVETIAPEGIPHLPQPGFASAWGSLAPEPLSGKESWLTTSRLLRQIPAVAQIACARVLFMRILGAEL